MSVRPFITCRFLTFLTMIFHVMLLSYLSNFEMLIPRTIKCNIISEASLSPKNVSISLNSILYLCNFATNILTICLYLNIYILLSQFWHSTSINVRLSYRFRASLLWMLSSLFAIYFTWSKYFGSDNKQTQHIHNIIQL